MSGRARPPITLLALLLALWLGAAGDSSSQAGEPTPALLLHQNLTEGYLSDGPDPEDVKATFAWIFSRLPSDVTVYPSENYFYFQLAVAGRPFWGNLRLATGLREKGQLSFAYAEFREFPSGDTNRLVRTKFLGREDGVGVKEIQPLEWQVSHRDKTVTFHLHPLRQAPPEKFRLGPKEEFVMRTFDESGCQFFLLFDSARPHFFWVLNEEELVPDRFDKLGEELLVGRRTGFAYWIDKAHSNRKVLMSVRRASANRNDYFDGPFDQLADNDVDKTHIADFIQRAYPITRGKIDKYGYWTNRTDNQRVGLACYGMYDKTDDLLDFLKRAKESPDMLEFIGRAQDGYRKPTAAAK